MRLVGEDLTGRRLEILPSAGIPQDLEQLVVWTVIHRMLAETCLDLVTDQRQGHGTSGSQT